MKKTCAGVVVAAGLSNRMKIFKPLLPYRDKTVVEISVSILLEAGVGQVFLVTGKRAAEIEDLFCSDDRVTCIFNPCYEDGDMWKSVRLGLSAASGYDKVFFLPGDTPGIREDVFTLLISHMDESGCMWTRPKWRNRGRHPLLLSKEAVRIALLFEGEGGLRAALHTLPEPPSEIPVFDPGCELDIDYYEDYQYLLRYEECKSAGAILIRAQDRKKDDQRTHKREGQEVPLYGEKSFISVNKSKPRIDGRDKITGRAVYAADIIMPNMLYAGVLRSGKAHALVKSINTEKAKAIPGVASIVTADDMPKPHAWSGYEYLTKHVRHYGDCVAMVAAESRELVDEALSAIEVEYEDLPVMSSIEEAMASQAVKIHDENDTPDNRYLPGCFKLRKGDVEKGFAEADVILEREYSTQHQEHAYIEPEACVCIQNPGDGQMTVYASAQNPFFTRRYVADILELPLNDVRLFQQTLGGSFGGKEESIGLVAARCAYLCRETGRPVKLVFKREESMIESVKRHPYFIKSKIGLKKDGTIVALQHEVKVDCGAYNNQAQFVNWKACAHSSGAYSIPNVKTDIVGIYTNNVPCGAYRGFGNPQMIYANEQLIEEAAEEIGMDPLAIRKKNLVANGKTNGVGQELEHVILDEIVDYTTAKTDYLKKHDAYQHQTGEIRKGIGMVAMMRGCGSGCETPDASGAMITVMEDGSILIASGLAENGQGLKTAYAQIASEAIGVPYESIRFYGTDTHQVPDSGMTVASRGTTMGAMSMKKAGLELREILIENAAEIMGAEKDNVDLRDGIFSLKDDPSVSRTIKDICGISIWSGHQMGVYSWYKPPKGLYSDHETGQGKVWPQYAYGVIIAEVEVDMGTGFVDVKKLTCSHDLGTVINPALTTGQICGGALQGMGYGTAEAIKFKNGKMSTVNYDKYIVPTAVDMPEFDINLFECDTDEGTYGAKSIGEPSLDGIAAAVANAVYNATGRRVRHNPSSMEKVLLGKELD